MAHHRAHRRHVRSKDDYRLGMMTIFDLNERFAAYSGPGYWTNPDMLEVGNEKLSTVEYQTHFRLWDMMASH